jgi:hypothetical protein
MNDDYLWDGSGEPDAEIQRLEALLSPLRYDEPLNTGDVVDIGAARSKRQRLLTYAAAAVVVLGIGVGVWLWRKPKPGEQLAVIPTDGPAAGMCVSDDPSMSWGVTRVSGSPSCEGGDVSAESRLAVGQWIETDRESSLEIEVANIGHVIVDADTRVGLLATASTEHRMRLERGTIHAEVNAPPRLFVVETPSATAVDLGCKYTLAVDDDGNGRLHVTFGYVALERDGREVFVPENAIAEIKAGVGPGTPYSDTATPWFRETLARFDAGEPPEDYLDALLSFARTIDTISLWHMLPRLPAGELRKKVYDRMAELSPPPDAVKSGPILDGQPEPLEMWRSDMEDLWLQGFEGPAELED